MIRTLAALALALLASAVAAAPDVTVPASVELKTVRLQSFAFAGGRTAPVRLAYRTLGSPRKGADGRIDNAVLLLHTTGGTGASFLGPKAMLLFGPGAPLDISQTFVVLPDAIGAGGSSKPSDSLGVNFPHYAYSDMVRGQRAIVRDELGITRLRLIVGVGMGAMHAWTWAADFPDEAAAVVAVGGWPVAVTGRNLVWRLTARDALLASPLPGGSGARIAACVTTLAVTPDARLSRIAPDAAAARETIEGAMFTGSPVDLAFQFDAVRGYDPSPRVDRITATLTAVNFADDPLYPADRDPLPAMVRRLTRINTLRIPAAADGLGHAALLDVALWLPPVDPAIRRALGR